MSTGASSLQIRTINMGPMDNNVYIVVDPDTNKAVIVDASEADPILDALEGLQVERILLTHGDADHIAALEEVRKATGAPVGIHAKDSGMLPSSPDFEIEDGQTISIGSSSLTVLYTPGHTPGSICLYTPGTLIAGDTLFPGGPGNTHGDKSKFDQIISSLREKLFVLPEDTKVLPGHGAGTTIGAEKPSLDEWVARGW